MRTFITACGIAALIANVAYGQQAIAPKPPKPPEPASLTHPSPGYNFYNMPGATAEDHKQAVLACRHDVRAIEQPDTQGSSGGGLLGALVVGIMKGVMDGIDERRGYVSSVENCMVARGWRVVTLPDAEGEAIKALPDASARQEKMKDWFGAETPPGQVTRTFHNEIATGSYMPGPPGDLDKTPLSLISFEIPKTETQPPKFDQQKKPAGVSYPKMIRSLKAVDLPKVSAEQAYLVVRVTGNTAVVGNTYMSFLRLSGDKTKPAWFDGQAAGVSVGNQGATVKVKTDSNKITTEDYVLPIPSGRWALAGVGSMLYHARFCFGAPTFEVRPGEVVFAGVFDMGHGGFPLGKVDAETAKAVLANAPALAARAVPAAYVNAPIAEQCTGSSAYAYEVPGAPFADNYVAGSKAPKVIAHGVAVAATDQAAVTLAVAAPSEPAVVMPAAAAAQAAVAAPQPTSASAATP